MSQCKTSCLLWLLMNTGTKNGVFKIGAAGIGFAHQQVSSVPDSTCIWVVPLIPVFWWAVLEQAKMGCSAWVVQIFGLFYQNMPEQPKSGLFWLVLGCFRSFGLVPPFSSSLSLIATVSDPSTISQAQHCMNRVL